jgi:hypothetical protein
MGVFVSTTGCRNSCLCLRASQWGQWVESGGQSSHILCCFIWTYQAADCYLAFLPLLLADLTFLSVLITELTQSKSSISVWNVARFQWPFSPLRAFLSGVKQLGWEADHSPTSSAEVNAWSCTSILWYVFMVYVELGMDISQQRSA